MRHSDINLTMSLYTHTLRGQESEAVENLPDLSLPRKESQKSTGTDDQPVGAYKKLAKKTDFDCKSMSSIVSNRAQELSDIEQGSGDSKPLQTADLGTRTDPLSSGDKSLESTERCRARTCDLLIKSQLLYQLS